MYILADVFILLAEVPYHCVIGVVDRDLIINALHNLPFLVDQFLHGERHALAKFKHFPERHRPVFSLEFPCYEDAGDHFSVDREQAILIVNLLVPTVIGQIFIIYGKAEENQLPR